MRKLVYSLTNSLDNFIASDDGGYDWILMGDEVANEFPKFFAAFDTVLLGRKTYDQTLRMNSGASQETSGFMGMETYVFSRTMSTAPDAGVRLVSDNACDAVRNLKNKSGKDVWLMGGGILAASLLREGPVDEIGVTIQPLLLGSGIPLFPDVDSRISLQLLDCRTYKNGLVGLKYGVKS
jgi:dihydrofolate reductase